MVLIALLVVSGCVSARVIRNDPGGGVVEYALKVKRAQSVKVDGWCASACTLYLAHSNLCITPRARFAFHQPFGSTPEENAKAKAWMLAQYPQWVRDWIAAKGGLTSRLIEMPNAYAMQHVRAC